MTLVTNELELLARLTLAAFCGGIIGWERERHSQPAGLRTHTILTIGAALAMTLSIHVAQEARASGFQGDPARLAAQVISGIGFLGAGAIIRFGASIKGLTTATSLWTVAIVGMAVGAGYYLAGIYATVLVLITLTWLDQLEKRVVVRASTRSFTVHALDREGLVEEVRAAFAGGNAEVKSISLSKNVKANELTIKVLAKLRDKVPAHLLVEKLSAVPGCTHIGME